MDDKNKTNDKNNNESANLPREGRNKSSSPPLSIPPSKVVKKLAATKKSPRCQREGCKKRVGVYALTCRCGKMFCALHIYSDKHGCTFDYKELGRQEIERNNPRVIGEKIKKI